MVIYTVTHNGKVLLQSSYTPGIAGFGTLTTGSSFSLLKADPTTKTLPVVGSLYVVTESGAIAGGAVKTESKCKLNLITAVKSGSAYNVTFDVM